MSRKKGKSPFEKFYGYAAKFAKNLRIFGEVGINLSKLYGLPKKIANKGNHCLFLGYERNHPHDTFRVCALKKKPVIFTAISLAAKSPNWLKTPNLKAVMEKMGRARGKDRKE
jgi:hypothetical protein